MEKVDYQITICSGSNLAHGSIACIGHHCPNVKINVLCRRPNEFTDKVTAKTDRCIWSYKGDLVGNIQRVSSDPAEVIPGSHIIIICSPSHVSGVIVDSIKDHIDSGAFLGCIYGGGGFDLQANQILGSRVNEDDVTLFGM
jgi:hypothetical protein